MLFSAGRCIIKDMRLWIKIVCGDKLTHSLTGESFSPREPLNADKLTAMLREILSAADLPTPAVLAKHVRHLSSFNITMFMPEDFVEHVDFDRMTVELAPDSDSEKRPHRRTYLDEV